jgi:hypothetical protein
MIVPIEVKILDMFIKKEEEMCVGWAKRIEEHFRP